MYITDILPCTLPVKFIYLFVRQRYIGLINSGSVVTLGRKRVACLGFAHSFWGVGIFFSGADGGGGSGRRGGTGRGEGCVRGTYKSLIYNPLYR